jgi:hypothetical protein
MAHVAPVAIGDADMHVFVCEKSPDMVTPDMLMGALPELIRVTICCALFVPTPCPAKLTKDGEEVNAREPITGILRGMLVAPCPYVAVIVPLPGPTDVTMSLPDDALTVATLVFEDT